MTRSVDDLAADVLGAFEKLRSAGRTSDILKVWCDDGIEALSELVALVGTLTQERDGWIRSAELAVQTWEAREAKQYARAEAAEAALADMRRALEEIASLTEFVSPASARSVVCAPALARRALDAAGPAPEEGE